MTSMSLEKIQREMAHAVMTPLTADEEMRRESPDGRSMEQIAASFIAPNSRLSSFERLEIYNRQYWFRVLGALAEDFPALRSVIGSRAFDAMSVAYLSAHPSRSFTLRNLGARLAAWLSANPQFAGRALGGGNTMFIEIEGIDAYHDAIKPRVTIVMPLVTQWYGMREFAIEDPDGYVITFAEPVNKPE